MSFKVIKTEPYTKTVINDFDVNTVINYQRTKSLEFNAIVDENGNYIIDENGNYIIYES